MLRVEHNLDTYGSRLVMGSPNYSLSLPKKPTRLRFCMGVRSYFETCESLDFFIVSLCRWSPDRSTALLTIQELCVLRDITGFSSC
jgi:hypothetical protein